MPLSNWVVKSWFLSRDLKSYSQVVFNFYFISSSITCEELKHILSLRTKKSALVVIIEKSSGFPYAIVDSGC